MKNGDSQALDEMHVRSNGRSVDRGAPTGVNLAASLTLFSVILLGTISETAPSPTTHELAASNQDTTVSFARNVFPIIQRSCVECHGATGEDGTPVVEEGLNMLTYDGLMAGSSYGKVIEAGNADESYLIELITDGDMPKEGDLLPPEEIQLIRRWINEGAKNN